MKTIFICKSLNLWLEGVDHRPYDINQRITIKHNGRWLPMVVEAVLEQEDLREITLKQQSTDNDKSKSHSQGLRPYKATADNTWLNDFVAALEGKSGPVRW